MEFKKEVEGKFNNSKMKDYKFPYLSLSIDEKQGSIENENILEIEDEYCLD